MFLIDNSIPFRNATLIQGHFQEPGATLSPGDQLVAEKAGVRLGIVKFIGILSANYTHNPTNPRYHMTITFEGDYRDLHGANLKKI